MSNTGPVSKFQKKLITVFLATALSYTPVPAMADNGRNTALGLGLGLLAAGLVAAFSSSSQASAPSSPPPTANSQFRAPVKRTYTLRQMAEFGDVNAQIKLATNYEEGRSVKQDNKEAFKWFFAAAKQQNDVAELKIAHMYHDGVGIDRDELQSFYWLSESAGNGNTKALEELREFANQSNSIAQVKLGHLYENGRGVLRDDVEAAKWYRLAGDQGYAEAQGSLGYMYENGRGVPRSYHEALRWYGYGAEQGNAYAQENLADMYSKGRGVSVDKVVAYKWLSIASAQKDGFAMAALRELEPSLSPMQIEDAQNRVQGFVPRASMTKREMHILNVLDDVRNFLVLNYAYLCAILGMLGLFVMRKAAVKALKASRKNIGEFFSKAFAS